MQIIINKQKEYLKMQIYARHIPKIQNNVNTVLTEILKN